MMKLNPVQRAARRVRLTQLSLFVASGGLLAIQMAQLMRAAGVS